MAVLHQTWALFRKDVLLEWRQRYAVGGVLLYVFSTVFVVYMAFINVQPQVWNVLFWIIMLFVSVNAIAKSFVQETGRRQLYYYTLADPLAVILSKMLYNTLLLLLLSVLTYGAFALVAGNPVRDAGEFAAAIFFGGLGFSVTFTFVSAIAAKADNAATLMAILGFPVVIPVLLTLVKLSANALRLIQDTDISSDLYILMAIDLLLIGLSIMLFPTLWRD